MTFDLLMMLLDGDWYNSPFMIPIAGCMMIGSIVVAGIWSGVRTREMKSQERLAMIARGLQPEPDMEQEVPRQATQTPVAARVERRPNDGAGARRAGHILCAIGVGLIVFFAFLATVLRERDVLSGASAGILPLAIGIGFLVDANHRRREYDRWLSEARRGHGSSSSSFAADEVPAPPPPPPPAPGMTPAQASDWRPLH